MKGHYIARTLTWLTGVWLIVYTIWLWMHQAVVVTDANPLMNTVLLVLILVLGVYFVALVARPEWVPNNRWMLAVLWIILILVAEAMLQDDASMHIYVQDIIKIIWAFLVITWPMKLLLTKEAEQKKFMEEVEIIEV